MLKVNGVRIKPPQTMSVDIEDIDATATRNVLGQLTRDRVATKRKLVCTWGALTNQEISTLLKAVTSEFFSVTYPDPQEGKLVTKTMYVGSRTAPIYTWHKGVPQWSGLSMNFIER